MIDLPDPGGVDAPGPTAVTPGTLATSGQQSIAEWLARLSPDRLRFFHGIGWHHWDTQRWATDRDGNARRALHDVLARLRKHAGADPQRKADIKSCESNQGQRGALEIASYLSTFAYHANDMDADTNLLNCHNGTLDLRTLELLPFNPENNITMLTNAAFDTSASDPLWTEFLDRILPDEEVRRYLQRYIGLSLLGDVLEHTLLIVIGTGANGKTTFYEAVSWALGDYSHTAESDLFMKAKTGPNAASPAIMALMGKRLVVTSETEEGAPLAVALMKNLTGGDEITTRGLFKDPITFRPSHTALMVTNHLPKVKGDDDALWRRITVVDFSVTIPESEQNPHLTNDLKLRAESILAWAVEGLADYRQQGLNPPPAVRRSTLAYRTASDDMSRFLNTQIDPDPNSWLTRKQLWTAWTTWCDDAGVAHGKSQDFYDHLDKRGFTAATRGGTRGFKGLALAKDEDTVGDDVFTDTPATKETP